MLTNRDITKPLLAKAFLGLRNYHHFQLRVIRYFGHSKFELKNQIWRANLEHKDRLHAQRLMAIHMQHCPGIPAEAQPA